MLWTQLLLGIASVLVGSLALAYSAKMLRSLMDRPHLLHVLRCVSAILLILLGNIFGLMAFQHRHLHEIWTIAASMLLYSRIVFLYDLWDNSLLAKRFAGEMVACDNQGARFSRPF